MPSESATIAATDPSTGHVKRNAGIMQAYALRQLAFDLSREVGLATDSQLSEPLRLRAQIVTNLIRAWAEADERARIARGRPLPGSLRPERKPKQRRTPTIAPIARVVPAPAPDQTEPGQATG